MFSILREWNFLKVFLLLKGMFASMQRFKKFLENISSRVINNVYYPNGTNVPRYW